MVKCRKESILSFLPSSVTPSDRKTGSTRHQTSGLTVAGSPTCRSLDVRCCPTVTLTVHVLSVDRMEASRAYPKLLGLWKLLDVWSHLSGPGCHGLTGWHFCWGHFSTNIKDRRGRTPLRQGVNIESASLCHTTENPDMGKRERKSWIPYPICSAHILHITFFYIYKGILVCDYFIF